MGSATSAASRRPARTASASWAEFSPTTRIATSGWRPANVLDEAGKEEVVGGAEGSQRGGAAEQSAGAADDVSGLAGRRERAFGLGAQQPPGVGELEASSRADEQRDAELGLEVGDLLGDARARQVERVGGGGERAMLGRCEEVRELLERHAVGRSYG